MFSGIGVTLIHDDGFIAAIVLMSVGVVLYPMMSTCVMCLCDFSRQSIRLWQLMRLRAENQQTDKKYT